MHRKKYVYGFNEANENEFNHFIICLYYYEFIIIFIFIFILLFYSNGNDDMTFHIRDSNQ